MTDSSIGIQIVTPFTGTSQGRNEAFRDQSAQLSAAKLAGQQPEQQDEPPAPAKATTHQLDVTV